jgi:hypothetical protein
MPVDEPGLLAQIQLLDAELALVEGQHLSLEEHVLALESGRQQHLLALADIDDRLLYQRQTLGRQLAAVYKASRRGLARMIFGAESPDDLRRVVVYELAIIRGLNRRVRDFQATQLQRKDALAALDRDSVALGNQRAELQLRGAELKDQRSRRLELLLEIRSRRDLTSQLAGEWQQAQRSFGDTIRPLPPPPSTVGLNAGPVGSGSSMSLTVSEPERSAASAEGWWRRGGRRRRSLCRSGGGRREVRPPALHKIRGRRRRPGAGGSRNESNRSRLSRKTGTGGPTQNRPTDAAQTGADVRTVAVRMPLSVFSKMRGDQLSELVRH